LIIHFAKKNNINIIPRTAGTSLADQCVGEGLIVDLSIHFTKILGFEEYKKNSDGSIRINKQELNIFLKPYGLIF